ncbi:MAG: ATP-binding protein [Cyclobacteriaceae bacterium]
MLPVNKISDTISRPIYERKVMPFINKDLIKVFIGQRRVGKSYLIFQIIQLIENSFENPNIIYINKENVDFDFIRGYQELIDYATTNFSSTRKNFIFIDEIQDIYSFEKALRHLQSQGQWDIYCTGSNAKMLSGELATFLSGRYIEIKVYSLSYREFLHFHQLQNTPDSFIQYAKFGGLPYLKNLSLQDRIVFDYLKNIYQAILFKDIVSRFDIRNAALLEQLSLYVADNIGNIVSAKKINQFLKSQHIQVSTNIILNYLQYLVNAFFILKVKRHDLKGKKILEVGEKYYMEDMGIRHALRNYRQNDIGQVFENLVFNHLKIWEYEVTIGKLYDKEIDFVCEKDGNTFYIQVCLSLADEKTRAREYGNLEAIHDNYRKIVVTGDEYVIENIRGIETWNIRKFLHEFE